MVICVSTDRNLFFRCHNHSRWFICYNRLIMKKIAVLTDSGCDASIQDEKDLGISVVRMPIVVDDKEYLEGVDIDSDKLYDLFAKGKLAKTAQVSQGILKNKYDELLRDYDGVLHIPLSGGLSGQYQSAYQLAKFYKGKVVVVDAKCACFPLAILARDAKILLDAGKTMEEVRDIIEKGDKMEALIIPYDINYLRMGGRISKAAASLANLLKIVPILEIKGDGKIDVFDKVRTEKRAIQRGLEYVSDIPDKESEYWMVIHDHRPEDAKDIADRLKAMTGEEVLIERFGPVILSHTGPKTIAFGHFKKLVR